MEPKQVGFIALRSPDGNFLPPIPIKKRMPEKPTKTEETAIDGLSALLAEKMKHYIEGCRRYERQKAKEQQKSVTNSRE